MTAACSTWLRRRSRSGFDLSCAVAFALVFALVPLGVSDAHAARPLFPTMAHVAGDNPGAVATGDLDHDGIRDLVVAVRWTEELAILRGLGGSDFAAPVRFAAGSVPAALAIADFNGDGRDDVAAALPMLDRVAVYLTGANGLPGAPLLLVAGDSPGGILAADLDRDGRTDLVATNLFSDSLTIWRGAGDGTFAPATTHAAGVRPYTVVTSLLNGDLLPDLAVANYIDANNARGEVLILLGDGAGGFTEAGSYPVRGGATRNLAAADVDGDGAVDLFFGTFDNSEEANTVGFLPGHGDGTFGDDQVIARTGDGDLGFGVADFNRDGRPDLAYSAHHGFVCCDLRDGKIALGLGQGSFSAPQVFRTGIGPVALAIDDLDGDGVADIAATNDAFWDQVTINLGRGDGGMGRDPEVLDPGFFHTAIEVGDVDGDPWPDIVASRFGQFVVLRGMGQGQFMAPLALPAASASGPLVLDDVNGDGLDDIAVRRQDTVIYSRSIGAGVVAAPLTLPAGETVRKLVSGEVTGDGISDLAALTIGGISPAVVVWSRPGEVGSFTVTLPIDLESPRSLTVGDLDGDGHGDIVVMGLGFVVLRGLGGGQFAAAVPQPGGDNEGALKSADIDGDGRDDVVAVATGGGARLYLGQPDGTLQPSTGFEHQGRPFDLFLDDFDADGRRDIVTIDQSGGDDRSDVSLILEPVTHAGPVARRAMLRAEMYAAAVGDVDGDGRVDFVAEQGLLRLALIRNQGPLPNRAPRALPAAENRLECTGPTGAVVTFDGRGSTDPDSTTPGQEDLATFEWFEDFGEASERLLAAGALADVTLPLGEHFLTLRVTDRAGASDTAGFSVNVVDTVAPAVSAAMTPARLWPPNHLYATVRADLAATDACGAVGITLVSVTSSEPDDLLGGGDGSTTNDIAGASIGTADLELQLRAERNALGRGRTYQVTYRAEDASGNGTEATTEVFVPISQSGRAGGGSPPAHGTGGGNNTGGPHSGNGRQGGPRPRGNRF
ncbi:MAG TPA: VCBS repeat-containing protein [Candidatus Polarisedimenticolia bacterium]|nr:VCBS repeat-containing protein [Candidatus Polarisedimenticolia bacterium]